MGHKSITAALPALSNMAMPDLSDITSKGAPLSLTLLQNDSVDGIARAGQFIYQGMGKAFDSIYFFPLRAEATRSLDESSKLPRGEWCYSHDRVTPAPRVRYKYAETCNTCNYAVQLDPRSIQCKRQAILTGYDSHNSLIFRLRLRGISYLNFEHTYQVLKHLTLDAPEGHLVAGRITSNAATSGVNHYYTMRFAYVYAKPTDALLDDILQAKESLTTPIEDEVPQVEEAF